MMLMFRSSLCRPFVVIRFVLHYGHEIVLGPMIQLAGFLLTIPNSVMLVVLKVIILLFLHPFTNPLICLPIC